MRLDKSTLEVRGEAERGDWTKKTLKRGSKKGN